MLNKTQILKMMKQHSAYFKSHQAKKVGIFGSFVRSEQTSKSDIDVLVEFSPGGKTFDNYMALKFYLENLFRRKIDLVMRESLKTKIKDKILSEVRYA